LWDVSSGEQWLTLTAGREPLTDVAFNLDGTRLATGGFEGRVRIYALKLEDLQGIAKSRLTRSLTE
jgi:WD40 repeat protein